MKKTAVIAIGLAALAISACAPRYYDHYDRSGYSERSGSYGDRDRDGVPNRYDRDRDNDGVPNSVDRRPNNPYRD
ncbi:MAG TPA: thrombospondin type 3 repeat-containing protein [Rhizomicrobium sp.]|nr:thrombospondin type 3 repeat-containing protein [Rhizomicrobium sp.]